MYGNALNSMAWRHARVAALLAPADPCWSQPMPACTNTISLRVVPGGAHCAPKPAAFHSCDVAPVLEHRARATSRAARFSCASIDSCVEHCGCRPDLLL